MLHSPEVESPVSGIQAWPLTVASRLLRPHSTQVKAPHSRRSVAFLNVWDPLPAFRSCSLGIVPCEDGLLMYWGEGGLLPLFICNLWFCPRSQSCQELLEEYSSARKGLEVGQIQDFWGRENLSWYRSQVGNLEGRSSKGRWLVKQVGLWVTQRPKTQKPAENGPCGVHEALAMRHRSEGESPTG